ncbi:MAG: hypothetical protein HFF17_00085 [Oscillospiraceae bacterium]|nr:hypothetical protein [Oscillospiraceae bacterium]
MYECTLFCPLISDTCAEERCAWFHTHYDPEDGTLDGVCALARIAEALQK